MIYKLLNSNYFILLFIFKYNSWIKNCNARPVSCFNSLLVGIVELSKWAAIGEKL